MVKYLYRSRGGQCTPDQVVICSGLQASIIAVLRLLKDEYGVVALEDPTYSGARSVYDCFDCPSVAIPVNRDGIDLKLLAQLATQFSTVFAGFQCTAPWPEQTVLARFMGSGLWEKHLRKICLVKKKKYDLFVSTPPFIR